jgi:hypothetical protein
MAKDEPELPLVPDDPELIKWVRWAYHHFVAEAAVIRGAPGALALAVLAAAVLIYFALEADHSREDQIKDATISYQATQLADYRNKLQVNSPDDAARKLADLEKRLDPILDDPNRPQRDLTDDQKQRLIEYAKPVKTQLADFRVYTSSSEERESEVYANRLTKAFEAAGLRSFYIGTWIAGKNDTGVILEMLDVDRPSDNAKIVIDILNKLGVAYTKRQHENDYPNQAELELFVNSP